MLFRSRLGSPVAGLKVVDGSIAGADGKAITYWQLASGLSLEREATGTVKPKPVSEHRYIGKSVPRIDLPAKVTGRSIFVQDLRPAGVVYGQIVRPPTYKARLASLDSAAIEKMPGVIKVVRNGSFLGVVATRQEQAIAAATAIAAAAKWEVEKALPGHDGMEKWLVTTPPSKVIDTRKQPRTGGAAPAKVIEATYFRPYQMHASIGTSAAIARMDNDGMLTIDTHSQSVFQTRQAIARMLGMDLAKVRCRHVQGSGCYGHNGADDAAADAALLAVAVPGRPIKLQYTREQEHRWEPYGSAMVVKTRAGVDQGAVYIAVQQLLLQELALLRRDIVLDLLLDLRLPLLPGILYRGKRHFLAVDLQRVVRCAEAQINDAVGAPEREDDCQDAQQSCTEPAVRLELIADVLQHGLAFRFRILFWT